MTTINTDLARKFSILIKYFQNKYNISFPKMASNLGVSVQELSKWVGSDTTVPEEPDPHTALKILDILEKFLDEQDKKAIEAAASSRKKPEPKVWLDFVEIPIVTGNGVTLIPYLMSTTPITNEVYGVFLEATNHRKPRYWDNSAYNRPKQPVVGVSWDDAMAFCAWAGVSLPSEVQWEYACRAGSTTKYHFGDDPKQLGEYAWYYENSKGKLQDVAQKKPNAWGLYDMHGNVWEWTADHCDVQSRVIRGGSWCNVEANCRSSFRNGHGPEFRNGLLGFRVIKGGSWCGDRCRSEDRDALDLSKRNNGLGFRVIKGSSFGAAPWSLCSTNSSKFTPNGQTDYLGFRVIKGGSWGRSTEGCRSSFHCDFRQSLQLSDLGFRVAQQIDQRISYIACQSVDPQQPQ